MKQKGASLSDRTWPSYRSLLLQANEVLCKLPYELNMCVCMCVCVWLSLCKQSLFHVVRRYCSVLINVLAHCLSAPLLCQTVIFFYLLCAPSGVSVDNVYQWTETSFLLTEIGVPGASLENVLDRVEAGWRQHLVNVPIPGKPDIIQHVLKLGLGKASRLIDLDN